MKTSKGMGKEEGGGEAAKQRCELRGVQQRVALALGY